MRKIITCLICGELAAIDDGFPNFQPVPDENGKLKLEEMPWPVLCETHELKLRLIEFDRLVTQLTHP